MSLHLPTLLFADGMLSLLLAVLVMLIRPSSEAGVRAARVWSIACVCLGTGRLAILLRHVDVELLPLSVLLVNALVLSGHLLVLQSLSVFVGRPLPRVWVLAGCLGFTGLFMALPATPEAFTLRAEVFGSLSAVLVVLTLLRLRRTPRALNGRWMMASALGVHLVGTLIRMAGAAQGLPPGAPEPSIAQSMLMLCSLLMSVTASIAFLMMLSDRARRHSESQARTDPLTELANRRAIQEMLERHADSGRPVSVAVIDLDHFKAVNDLHGHAAGDLTLQRMAVRLREVVRQGDLAGRLGGEEFVLLLPDAGAAALHEVLARLRQRLATAPIGPNGQTVRFSAGIASTDEVDRPHHEQLLERADARLYQAKRRRDTVVGPDPLQAELFGT